MAEEPISTREHQSPVEQTAHELTLTDRELAERLGWFTHVRWAVGGGALLLLLLSWHLLGIRFGGGDDGDNIFPAVNVILLVFLYNAAFAFATHIVSAKGRITRRLIVRLAMAQLACDVIAVCAVAHYTGGVENFFIVLVILPLVIATELLPRLLAYLTAGAAAVLVNVLAWFEGRGVIPHVAVRWPGRPKDSGLYADPLYVLQVTVALTATIFLMVFVAVSISKRLRRREFELGDAYRRLALADEAKSFFMRKAGHELRAPLAAIHSILEAIADTSRSLEDKHRDLIARTQRRTVALMSLVDDLRRYSFLRSPEGVVKVRSLSLSDIVATTVELFRPQATALQLQLSAAVEPVEMEGDEEMLRELVTNLVANAIQYTPAGGRIDVSLIRHDAVAAFSVTDTGIGISDQAVKDIFREFYRSHEARKLLPHGTGLGLAITRQIAHMHGGCVEVVRRKEGGTIFSVYLPLAPRAEDAATELLNRQTPLDPRPPA